ncbi:MAG: ABC transporter ATP-binding protein [Chloroflexota bacterium]
MTAAELAIDVQGLVKRYGRKVAVDGVSFRVSAGTTLALLGPNGAGKSTTVKMLVGLVRPTGGIARVLGGDPTDPATRRDIGYVPEQFRFPEWLHAADFVGFHAALADVPARERTDRVVWALDLVGLAHRQNDVLGTFSKGMLQRVGIAQALVGRPRLVVLDEPTSALDPIGRRDIRDLVLRLRAQGVTVVLNSHLLGEVERTCDHVVMLDRGRVVEAGPMATLMGTEITLELRATGVSPALVTAVQSRWREAEPLSREDGVVTMRISITSEAEAGAVARVLHEGGAEVRSLVPRRRSLEDLFVSHVLTDESGQLRGAR